MTIQIDYSNPLYLNVCKYKNSNKWFVLFDSRYIGAADRKEAVRLRKNFIIAYEQYPWWKRNTKTVRVVDIKTSERGD
jgi:hypothetical protein